MSTDILLDQDGDLAFKDGDLVIGDATLQNQHLILVAHKGEYKDAPEIGVGITDALLEENPRRVLSQIRRNFEYDGMKVETIDLAENGNLIIDAVYKE